MDITASRLVVAIEASFAYPPYEDEQQDVMSNFLLRARVRIEKEFGTLLLHKGRQPTRVRVANAVRPEVQQLGEVLWRGSLTFEGPGDWASADAKQETAMWLNNLLSELAAERSICHPPITSTSVTSMQTNLEYAAR